METSPDDSLDYLWLRFQFAGTVLLIARKEAEPCATLTIWYESCIHQFGTELLITPNLASYLNSKRSSYYYI